MQPVTCCALVGKCCHHVTAGIVTFIIAFLYYVFMFYHLAPAVKKNPHDFNSWIQLAVFQILSGMVVVTLIQVMNTNPGHVPDTEEWFAAGDALSKHGARMETKHSGALRYCKWCEKYKPDRCHHCRICNTCVLKMDHHCPWISNCVGFGNYKYFFTHLLYGSATSIFIAIYLYPTMQEALKDTQASTNMVFVVTAEAMAVFMAMLVTPFLLFHTFLLCNNMTTIEYCEKATKYRATGSMAVYDVGCFANITSALGPLYLWLLPINTVHGDGLTFANEDTLPLLHKKKNHRQCKKDTFYLDARTLERKNTLL